MSFGVFILKKEANLYVRHFKTINIEFEGLFKQNRFQQKNVKPFMRFGHSIT